MKKQYKCHDNQSERPKAIDNNSMEKRIRQDEQLRKLPGCIRTSGRSNNLKSR